MSTRQPIHTKHRSHATLPGLTDDGNPALHFVQYSYEPGDRQRVKRELSILCMRLCVPFDSVALDRLIRDVELNTWEGES